MRSMNSVQGRSTNRYSTGVSGSLRSSCAALATTAARTRSTSSAMSKFCAAANWLRSLASSAPRN